MKDTLAIINRMQTDGVIKSYAIGGAVGATFYLEPVATLDVDVFVALPNRSSTALLNLAPICTYLTARGCTVKREYIVVGEWPVQFLAAGDELEREALREAVDFHVEGVRTRVMTAEHLVAIALKTGRAKDFTRILQFLDQAAVNKDKLNRILSKYGLAEKWKNFRRRFLNE